MTGWKNTFLFNQLSLCLLLCAGCHVCAVRQLNLYEVPYTLYAVNDGLCHVGLTASVLLTVSITVERHSAVCSATNYQTRQARAQTQANSCVGVHS